MSSPAADPGISRDTAQRRRVVVVAADMGAPSVVRAYHLAELFGRRHKVQLIGPSFSGEEPGIWAPIRGANLTLRTFAGRSLPEFATDAERFLLGVRADLVCVAEPHLPSLLLGALLKHLHGSPVVVDVAEPLPRTIGVADRLSLDELEARRDEHELTLPRSRIWTLACAGLIADADAVLVAGERLKARYGGTVLPQVRDERLFNPARIDRQAARAKLGFGVVDRVILAPPTAGPSLIRCTEAIREIRDPRFRLLVLGPAPDPELRAALARAAASRITIVEPASLREVPSLTATADLCFLPDDARSELCPGTLAEAFALGVPVLADGTRRLTALERELVHTVTDGPLSDQISELCADQERLGAHVEPARAHFRSWMAEQAYLPLVDRLVDEVSAARNPMPASFGQLVRLARGSRPRRIDRRPRAPVVTGTAGKWDIVFLSYLNDSGIYGRRADMLMKYLAQTDWTARLIHLDPPVTWGYLRSRRAEAAKGLNHWSIVERRTRRRALLGERAGKLRSYTFLAQSGQPGKLERRMLPTMDEYLGFVRDVLDRNGVGRRPLLCWVWPPNPHFRDLHEMLSPDLTVSDVVDDERSWQTPASDRYEQTTHDYQSAFELSDLVITNTAQLSDRLALFGVDAPVVPNAMEVPAPATTVPRRPRELRGLTGPLIGYVGGISWRIDVALLDRLARERPDCQLVIIGSAHGPRDVLALDEHENVHFLGPRTYPDVLRYVQCFDVALIPHLDNEMTRAMNPLKAFMYAGCGVPVVSTGISSLDGLRDAIQFAASADEFIAAVNAVVDRPRSAPHPPPSETLVRDHSWQARVHEIERLLDGLQPEAPDDQLAIPA